jgi:hypothetical protein
MNKSSIAEELIQIRPKWVVSDNGDDVNRWSRVHPRFEMHDGCVVDLGCLGWNRPFEDIDSDNWAGYFFDKKRVIGVDPQENMNPKAELFRGFISNFSGKGFLISTGIGATLFKSTGNFFEFLNWDHFKQKFNIKLIIRAILSRTLSRNFEVLNWYDFKQKFNIKSISVLKINIEGSE